MLFPYMPQRRAQVGPTEQIGPGGMPRQQPQVGYQNPPQQAPQMSYQSPSVGMFQNYMSQIFNQRYRPQQALGGYQNFGSYGGFMPQQMPGRAASQPMGQPSGQPMTPSNPLFWDNPNNHPGGTGA